MRLSQAAPYPSYATLARRMGITPKMARRYAQNLERKGFLLRIRRGGGNTNRFDLTPLFDKLLEVVQASVPAAAVSGGVSQVPVAEEAPMQREGGV